MLALLKQTKKCSSSTCEHKEPQPLENFYKNKSLKSGLQNQCIKCHKLSNKIYSKNNPEKNNAKSKRLREKLRLENPEKAWALIRNQRLKAEYLQVR